MSRSHPWVSKCPPRVQQLIQQLPSTRLYLVRETGPTAFILTDGEDLEASTTSSSLNTTTTTTTTTTSRHNSRASKYKVRIGAVQKCSCGAETPCIHILYVFCKIFRVPDSNPLIWQRSLIDHEINQILQGRVTGPSRATVARSKRRSSTRATRKATRRQLDEGDVCPICQEDMNQVEYLIFCHECGQNIHTKCMKIWADHRTKCHEDITCPLCRTPWSPTQVQQLSHVNRKRYITSTAHTGVKCDACSMLPIQGERFKCTICADYNLCTDCLHYKSIHTQHPFDKKENPKDEHWIPVERVISLERPVEGSQQGTLTGTGGIQGTRTHNSHQSRRRTRRTTNNETNPTITRRHARRRASSTRRERVSSLPPPSQSNGLDLSVVSTQHAASQQRALQTTTTTTTTTTTQQPTTTRRRRRAQSFPSTSSSATASSDQPSAEMNAVLMALQHRELSENDYELLLQLDTPKDNGIPKYIFGLLPQVHVNEHNHSDFADDTCSICLCNYNIGDDLCNLKCMHYYHYACISKWLDTHNSCCVCNYQITAEDYPPPSRIQMESHEPSLQEDTSEPPSETETSTESSEEMEELTPQLEIRPSLPASSRSSSSTNRQRPSRPTSRAPSSRSNTSTTSSQSTTESTDNTSSPVSFGITGSHLYTGGSSQTTSSSGPSSRRSSRRGDSVVGTHGRVTRKRRPSTNRTEKPASPSTMDNLIVGVTASNISGRTPSTPPTRAPTQRRPLIRSESMKRMKRSNSRRTKPSISQTSEAPSSADNGSTSSGSEEKNLDNMFNVLSATRGQVHQKSTLEKRPNMKSHVRRGIRKRRETTSKQNDQAENSTEGMAIGGRRI